MIESDQSVKVAATVGVPVGAATAPAWMDRFPGRRRARLLGWAACLVFCWFGAPAWSAPGVRAALVIGINEYQKIPPLQTAASDARAISKVLSDAGFAVVELINPDRRSFLREVRELARRAEGGGESVLFYAGHGVQVDGQNYLLPVDIAIQDASDLVDSAVPLQFISDRMAESKVRFSLMVIDACRDNPLPKLAGRSLGAPSGLAPTSVARGQTIIYSAANGQQALDRLSAADNDPNSVFTRVLLRQMRQPGVNVVDLLRRVRSEVQALARSVRHEQYPAIYDESQGDFVLFAGAAVNPTGVANSRPPSAPGAPRFDSSISADEIEREHWLSIRDSRSPADFEEFIKAFPAGKLVGVARTRLRVLTAVATGSDAARAAEAPTAPTTTAPAPTTTAPAPTATAPAPLVSAPAATGRTQPVTTVAVAPVMPAVPSASNQRGGPLDSSWSCLAPKLTAFRAKLSLEDGIRKVVQEQAGLIRADASQTLAFNWEPDVQNSAAAALWMPRDGLRLTSLYVDCPLGVGSRVQMTFESLVGSGVQYRSDGSIRRESTYNGRRVLELNLIENLADQMLGNGHGSRVLLIDAELVIPIDINARQGGARSRNIQVYPYSVVRLQPY